MIVFVSDINLIPAISYKCADKQIIILNLSSFYSGYGDVTNLITKLSVLNNTGQPMPIFIESLAFDMQYANAVLTNDQMFNSFMNIMIHAYEGFVVVVLVQRDQYRDSVMESLIKLIQQRYGYDSWIVESLEDVSCLSEPFFTPQGILNMDADLQRFQQLYANGSVEHVLDPTINVE